MTSIISGYKIEKSTKQEQEALDNKLGAFNLEQWPATQEQPVVDLSYSIKKDGRVIAGINAAMYFWHILYIDILFVEDGVRKQGLGSYLLNRVEQEALEQGAKLAHLSTYDFQAVDFYKQHGFEDFGILDYWPGGPKRHYMKKVL
jgi:GNAT superfamily N-acetyltransferase